MAALSSHAVSQSLHLPPDLAAQETCGQRFPSTHASPHHPTPFPLRASFMPSSTHPLSTTKLAIAPAPSNFQRALPHCPGHTSTAVACSFPTLPSLGAQSRQCISSRAEETSPNHQDDPALRERAPAPSVLKYTRLQRVPAALRGPSYAGCVCTRTTASLLLLCL